MGIHNYDMNYATALRRVKEIEISEKNKEFILNFLNDRMLDGMSKPRQMRYIDVITFVAKRLQKDLDAATKEDMKEIVGEIQRGSYKPWTKHTYKVMIRGFFKWLRGTESYPEEVSWISIRISRSEMHLPSEGDLLGEQDIERLFNVVENPRDKAFISILWESGARVGEIGNLCLKHIQFDAHGVQITVHGKTGSRKIRLIASTPHLSTWINTHPSQRTGETALWLNVGTRNHNKPMCYITISTMLRRYFRLAGIKKKCNPHLFRHSRATYMAKYLTEFQMNQYFGWIQGSKMASTYVHISGRDVDNAILKMNGFAVDETQEQHQIQARKCPRCDTINSHDAKHCNKCGGILDLKYAMEMEEQEKKIRQERGNADALMSLLLKDQDVQKMLMEKMVALKQLPIS